MLLKTPFGASPALLDDVGEGHVGYHAAGCIDREGQILELGERGNPIPDSEPRILWGRDKNLGHGRGNDVVGALAQM
jgi:hypothetical protein